MAERKASFINIQDETVQQADTISPDRPIVGKSTLTFCETPRTKSARKVADILRKSTEAGIFQSELQPGDLSLIHDLTGIAFVNTATKDSRKWFMHARVLSPNGKGEYQWSNATDIKSANNIKVITGPCLFSASAVQAIDTNGQYHALTDPSSNGHGGEIVEINIDHRIQPYEAESILRLTSVMANINASLPVEIGLNIPREEYWYYALDSYEQGQIDSELLLRWFNDVDKRNKGLMRLMEKRLPNLYRVSTINPLSVTEQFIVDAVQRSQKNLFEPLIEILENTSEAWRHAITQTQPERFLDLCYLSYMVVYLEKAREAGEDGGIVLAIENPEETKIMDQTKPLLTCFANKTTILGVYPHSNITLREEPSEGHGKRFLYFFGVNGSLLHPIREAVRANK